MSGMPNKTTLSFVVLLCLMICAPAWSQTNVGQITGQVADSSGAPIAACAVTATNVQTGLKQIVNTDSSGSYVFPSLPTGAYNLRAENRGFRPAESTGVILDAASRRTVDFKLEVGSVTEAVTVTAAAGIS